jgi:hypothetical protein
MIIGAHSIVYSKDPDADRAFLQDVLRFPHVDAGHGWLIFGLPPAEVAVHPTEGEGSHELYLMVDDVEAFVQEMAARDVACAPVTDQRWGRLTAVSLPGGGELGVYEPRHPRPPEAARPRRAPKKTATKKKTKASSRPARKTGRGSASTKRRRRRA